MYEVDYMRGAFDSDDVVYQDTNNVPRCKFNYLTNYLGNAVEFTAPALTPATDTVAATNAMIRRNNGSDTTDRLDYVFTVRTKNAENGKERDDDPSLDRMGANGLWTKYWFYS